MLSPSTDKRVGALAGRVLNHLPLRLGGTLKKYLLPLGVAALLLSGCSSESAESEPVSKDAPDSSAPSSAPAAESADAPSDTLGPGSYTFDTGTGAVGTLEVPGEPPTDIEALRIASGGESVAYLTGNLDNREGTELFDVYTISVYDLDGNKYEYEPADDYISSIKPEDVFADNYRQYGEAQDGRSTVFDPLERGDFVMVGPPLPEQIAGVSVSNGLEDFGAQPAG